MSGPIAQGSDGTRYRVHRDRMLRDMVDEPEFCYIDGWVGPTEECGSRHRTCLAEPLPPVPDWPLPGPVPQYLQRINSPIGHPGLDGRAGDLILLSGDDLGHDGKWVIETLDRDEKVYTGWLISRKDPTEDVEVDT